MNEFLVFEGPVLLDMRIKHLMKTKQLTQATALAKLCSDHPEISAKGNFKQTYLVCLCSGSPNEKLMEEVSKKLGTAFRLISLMTIKSLGCFSIEEVFLLKYGLKYFWYFVYSSHLSHF